MSGSPIAFSMLGSTELRRNGQSLDSILGGAKRLGVFAYLTLTRPRGFQRRDKVLPLFWPERGQKNARNALSNMLYHIRQELGEDVILNRGAEEIGVQYDSLSCDVLDFETALDYGDPERALALYRGDLLNGFHVPGAAPAFDHWLDRERDRLRRRMVEGAWSLAETAEAHGDLTAARKWARQAAGLRPYSDETQQRLIALLYRTGDRTGALQAYEAFAERLRTEWEIEPTEEMRAWANTLNTPAAKTEGPTVSSSTNGLTVPSVVTPDPSPPPAVFESPRSSNEIPQKGTNRTWGFRRWLAGGVVLAVLLGIMGVWTVGTGASSQKQTFLPRSGRSVAVLPFTALGTQGNTDYFSLGITEELLTRLARVKDLSVISRTSVMRYQDTDKPLQQIAAELGVDAVVEGSVQRDDDRVRITAQLIDATTDHHLWAASYDRTMENVLVVQSDVALRIAEALTGRLLPQERVHLTAQRDVDETAYHLYLRAKYLLEEGEPTGVARAAALFQEALAHDSAFAPAYGGLAMASVQLGLFDGKDPTVYTVAPFSPDRAESKALQSAERALALDSTVVDAYLARALVYEVFQQDWKRSEHAFKQALRLTPSRSTTHREFGWQMLRLGHVDRALTHMQTSVALDPLSWAAHHGLGYTLHCNRQYEEAIQTLETALKLGSGDPITRKHLHVALLKRGQQLAQQEREAEALDHLKRAGDELTELWGAAIDPQQQRLLELAATGPHSEALAQLDHVSLPFAPRLYVNLILEQRATALTMIEQAGFFNKRRVFADPIFDTVRTDPRFARAKEHQLKEGPFTALSPLASST